MNPKPPTFLIYAKLMVDSDVNVARLEDGNIRAWSAIAASLRQDTRTGAFMPIRSPIAGQHVTTNSPGALADWLRDARESGLIVPDACLEALDAEQRLMDLGG